jgi:Flp pilus assembly protein TadD
MRQAVLGLLAAALLAACASAPARAQTALPAPAVRAGAPAARADPAPRDAALPSSAKPGRAPSPRARTGVTGAETVEHWSEDLGAALSHYAAAPTLANEVGLAQAYVRLGILDKAHEHFTAAARLDPKDGSAWDGLARIWRDWGFPAVGLGDAYRAVYAAPQSPAAHNTLGTILQLIGDGSAARAQFERALALDPGATYARNNLCYSRLMEAGADAASAGCARALDRGGTHERR